MREKINKAARGEFTYSVPKIKLSITELTISVNAGEIVRGEFVVSNDQEEDMRGMRYHINLMQLLCNPAKK